MLATTHRTDEIEYPSSDGKPMAESDIHRQEIMALIFALETFFKEHSDVYVAGNNLIYYQEHKRKKCFSPDVYVVFGVANHTRVIYQVWKEKGRLPAAVFEITSKSTKNEDMEKKKNLCERLGVTEYFLYDAMGEYLQPALQGHRLVDSRYVRIEPDLKGFLHSEALSLKFFLDKKGKLRVVNPVTGKILERDKEALARADAEAKRADTAEAKIAKLEEELKRLKNGHA